MANGQIAEAIANQVVKTQKLNAKKSILRLPVTSGAPISEKSYEEFKKRFD